MHGECGRGGSTTRGKAFFNQNELRTAPSYRRRKRPPCACFCLLLPCCLWGLSRAGTGRARRRRFQRPSRMGFLPSKLPLPAGTLLTPELLRRFHLGLRSHGKLADVIPVVDLAEEAPPSI